MGCNPTEITGNSPPSPSTPAFRSGRKFLETRTGAMGCLPHIQIEPFVRWLLWQVGSPWEITHPGEHCRSRHANMKQKSIALSQRYVTALRTYLKQGPRASLQPALRLGREAV